MFNIFQRDNCNNCKIKVFFQEISLFYFPQKIIFSFFLLLISVNICERFNLIKEFLSFYYLSKIYATNKFNEHNTLVNNFLVMLDVYDFGIIPTLKLRINILNI